MTHLKLSSHPDTNAPNLFPQKPGGGGGDTSDTRYDATYKPVNNTKMMERRKDAVRYVLDGRSKHLPFGSSSSSVNEKGVVGMDACARSTIFLVDQAISLHNVCCRDAHHPLGIYVRDCLREVDLVKSLSKDKFVGASFRDRTCLVRVEHHTHTHTHTHTYTHTHVHLCM